MLGDVGIRYGQQQHIGAWNVARLLESMAPLMDDVSRLQPVLDHYMEFAMNAQSETWGEKLGLNVAGDRRVACQRPA